MPGASMASNSLYVCHPQPANSYASERSEPPRRSPANGLIRRWPEITRLAGEGGQAARGTGHDVRGGRGVVKQADRVKSPVSIASKGSRYDKTGATRREGSP